MNEVAAKPGPTLAVVLLFTLIHDRSAFNVTVK